MVIIGLFVIFSGIFSGGLSSSINKNIYAVASKGAASCRLTEKNAEIETNDLTSELKVLGQPFELSEYARNIWDMQLFEGRIYLGCGNLGNYGPGSNAGPVPVIYYDIENGEFVTQAIIDEEQIDIYKILDGRLVIPGQDPMESWDYGNFYTLTKDGWEQMRTIPDGIHVFDMESLKGNLFAAVGTRRFGAAVMSADMGKTWVSLMPEGARRFFTGGRAYSVFHFKEKLYFAGALFGGIGFSNKFLCIDYSDIPQISGITDSTNADIADASVDSDISAVISKVGSSSTEDARKKGYTVYAYNMLPGAGWNSMMRLVRVNEINDKLVYIAAYLDNGSQWLNDALYTAEDINRVKRIRLPEPHAVPMDIILRNDNAYLLTHKESADSYSNIVYSSEDMYNWSECFRFTADTFARSFEESDGVFYFGMGCYIDHLSEATGSIVRIAVND